MISNEENKFSFIRFAVCGIILELSAPISAITEEAN
jgi:hypothetical protein